MTADGNNTLVYDAENRLLSATNGGASGAYTYDGNGLRVEKVSGSTTTVYIFSGSKVIAEYDNGAAPASPSREYIYSGGALIAKIDSSGSTYYHPDQLSNRLTTDSSGNLVAQMGHYPFGDSWYNSTNDKLQFTTYERDAESGNDYAMARSYVNNFGRFSSLDPLSGSLANPQSLNKYAYVLNDPVNLVDPSGLGPAYAPALDAWTWLDFAFNVFINAAGGSTFAWDGSLTLLSADQHLWLANNNAGLLGTLLLNFDPFPPGIPGGTPPLINLGPAPQPPPPLCSSGSLNDQNLFWADNFATPEQVDQFFQSTNGPGSWDGYAAAAAFIAQGINPGLAVGIIGAETSFGNNGLSQRNAADPFSSGGANFAGSLSRGLGTVVKLENHTFTDGAPLSALINGRNDLPSNIPGSGQAYTTTDRGAYPGFIDSWFRRFAKFIGKCK
jgi:RHS repeat-associated protein